VIATTHHHRYRFALAVSAAAFTCSCNFIVEPDRVQCETDEDCTKRGESFQGTECIRSMCVKADPIWGCMDKPQPPAGPAEPHNVLVRATNIISTLPPIAGAHVKLCNRIDTNPDPALDCQSPLSPPDLVTNEAGEATLTVNNNFTGYVAVFPPEKPGAPPADQYVPGYYYFNPGVTSDMTVATQIATFGLVTALTGLLEAEQRDDRGLVLLNALNCQGIGAAGVVFKSDGADDQTVTFYAQGSLPVKGLTATEASGFGGFVNIEARLLTITGEVAETGRQMGSVSLVTRPKAITYTRLVPIGQPP